MAFKSPGAKSKGSRIRARHSWQDRQMPVLRCDPELEGESLGNVQSTGLRTRVSGWDLRTGHGLNPTAWQGWNLGLSLTWRVALKPEAQ